MLTETEIPKSDTLTALHAERQLCRNKLQADAASLDRAVRNVEAITHQHYCATRAIADHEEQLGEHLASSLAADEPATSVERDRVTAQRLGQELADAQHALSIAVKARAALQAAHKATSDKLAELEADIATEADVLLEAHREALAEEAERANAALIAAVEKLRAYCPNHLNTPLNQIGYAKPLSPRVLAALNLLPSQGEYDIHTPMNQLRGSTSNGAANLNATRRTLIEGEEKRFV